MSELQVGDRAEKIGGSYQATGKILAAFEADDGSPRFVFRFDYPPGLLHIFHGGQLRKLEHFRQMSKPLWSDAPSWAKWLAMDSSGSWYWYEQKPERGNRAWDADGELDLARLPDHEWEESLESKPDHPVEDS